MTIEEAIQTAIQLENKVRDVYRDAAGKITDPVGKRIFNVLADEEQGHVDYLEERLAEWRRTGTVSPTTLDTAVPSQGVIAEAVHNVSANVSQEDRGMELDLLGKALHAERSTSRFYKKMVAELPQEGQALFERFVVIEEGHQTIVQAEIDSVTGTGAWFDVLEVKL
jgi:rubrerythrin